MIKKKKSSTGTKPSTKKPAPQKGSKVSVAFTGKKGFGHKPSVGGGGGNFSDFIFFQIPKGSEEVVVVPLEDTVSWFAVHQYKSVTDKFFGKNYLLSPRDPDNPEKPSFVDIWLEKDPARRRVLTPVKTVAGMTVWVPNGVPGKDGKVYQENGRKYLVIATGGLKVFESEYKEQARNGRDLRGVIFKVDRSDRDKSPAIGDSWIPRSRYKLEAIERKLQKPQSEWSLDWKKLFLSVTKDSFKELVARLMAAGPVDTAEDDSEDIVEDDIPF